MKKTAALLSVLGVLTLAFAGCNNQPDPKANPKFDEKTLMDPGGIKMGADAPQPTTK